MNNQSNINKIIANTSITKAIIIASLYLSQKVCLTQLPLVQTDPEGQSVFVLQPEGAGLKHCPAEEQVCPAGHGLLSEQEVPAGVEQVLFIHCCPEAQSEFC